jgi:ribosomal protein S18 acetylase RimI-like enzyme
VAVVYEWRGRFESAEAKALHAEAFDVPLLEVDWNAQTDKHSLGWVCARNDDELVGFVNLAWDGRLHAFILDTMVSTRLRGQGIGTQLVAIAAAEARAARCAWLHVDFWEHLREFYVGASGFTPTAAGLIRL